MTVYATSIRNLEKLDQQVVLTFPTRLVTFADPELERPPTPSWAEDHLHLAFCDLDEPVTGFSEPTATHAQLVWIFAKGRPGSLVAACTAGAGRSQAVAAAFSTLEGKEPVAIFQKGTYNRLLYRLIVKAGGSTVPAEPLVSLVVRAKYPIDRSTALIRSFQRQRWKNWEMILVTDGQKAENFPWLDGRVILVETKEKLGRWGHPHRQVGIEAAQGAYIGLSNDDNYYVPGYFDQMVYALEHDKAELVLCNYIGHYLGWQEVNTSPRVGGCDLGCWLARAELVKSTPWEGTEFDSDGKYVERLAAKAKGITKVNRPLFVHN